MKFCPLIFESFIKAYMHDTYFREVYQKIKLSSTSGYEGMDEFHIENVLVYKYNVMCVPKGERILLIREAYT